MTDVGGQASEGQAPEGQDTPAALPDGPALAATLEDWLTIWQSEANALLLDPELREWMLRLIDGGAAQARAGLRALAPLLDAAGRAGPVSPPGAPAPSPAPGAAPLAAASPAGGGQDAVIAALLVRVAELERQLAGG